MTHLKIAVIAGGDSAEATVSRSSAAEVSKALRTTYPDVRLLELDRTLTRALADYSPDIVFPVLHGPPGEDGTVQGYLDILGLSYVGSGVLASACAMDKSVAKAVFRSYELPIADDLTFPPDADPEHAARTTLARFGDRVVIKPRRQGSGLGVTPVMNGGDLCRPFEAALAFGDGVLVEPFVLGHEITVGVLDVHGESIRAFPPIEIRTPTGTWYDYEHRYTVGKSEHLVPAPLDDALSKQVSDVAVRAHLALGCRDLSRADFIVTDDRRVVLLEVNTLPGMTPTSLYPDGARAVGITFEALVAQLVESAYRRSRASAR
jgi:D-alanine-D-alanine ligase